MRRRDRYVGTLSQQGADFQGVATAMLTGTPSTISAIGSLPPNVPGSGGGGGGGGPVQFSLELWFQLTVFSSAFWYPLLNKIDVFNPVGGYQAELGFTGTTQSLYFTSWDATTGNTDTYGGPPGPDGSWHHLVCTADETNQNVYMDGGAWQMTDLSGLVGASAANATALLMGFCTASDDPVNGGGFLAGAICRVAFYRNTVLSAGQVAAHFAASGPSYDATITSEGGISAYWPLNETSGTVAHDLVGGHHGTYTGGCALAHAGPGGANAVLLDGSSGYVTVPNATALNPN